MKKFPWGGIIGGLLVIIYLIGGITNLVNPTKYSAINVSNGIDSFLTVCFGVFLVFQSLERKKREGMVGDMEMEDEKEVIKKKRNRILFYVIIVSALFSVTSWSLNLYPVDFSLGNIYMIFDFLMNLVLMYFAVQLYKNNDVTKPILYTILVYSLGMIVISFLRKEYVPIVAQVGFAGYFLYALRSQLDKHHYRIAHFVMLPAVFLLTFAASAYDDGHVSKLIRDEAKAEQEYINASEDVAVVNSKLWNQLPLSQKDLISMESALNRRDMKDKEIRSLLKEIDEEYSNRVKSEEQIMTRDRIQHTNKLMDLNQAQGSKGRELLNYLRTIDVENISNTQRVRIQGIMSEIDSYVSQVRDLDFAFKNQN
jgi:hypothetical protein